MASRLGRSRLSNSSSDASSSSRGAVSKALAPLQVDRGFGDGSWGKSHNFEVVVPNTKNAAATRSRRSEITRSKRRHSPRSDIIVTNRLNELSQLESPLLRDLAQRLGEMLKIETPRCHKKFKHPYADLHVGDRWEALQGCFGWKGLLEPNVDRVLKAEILRYGEFAQATYDAFDHDNNSKHNGTCKYLKTDLLEKVGLENRGYEITNFLYATTNLSLFPHFLVGPAEDTKDSNEDDTVHSNEGSEKARAKCSVHGHGNSKDDNGNSTNIEANSHQCENCSRNSRQCNWIGFVAVCTSPEEIARLGRRDIVIAWRGSVTTFDWIADMMDYMSPAGFGPDIASSSVRVEKGFLHLYTSTNSKSRYCHTKSARDQVHDAIRALVMKYKDKGKLSITLTGHSLGSALATMCAYDIAECQVDLLTPSVSSEWNTAESRHEVRGPEDQLTRHHPSSNFSRDASPIRASLRENEHHWERRGGISPRSPLKKFLSRQNHFVNKFRTDRIPVSVYSFGGPRVGNRAFVDRMEELGVAVLRVVNVHDKVTKVPGLMRHHLTEKLSQLVTQLPSYKHVGVKFKVDNELSDVLQKPAGLKRAHCLEGYLHLVDAYQGIVLDSNEKNLSERLLSSSHSWFKHSKQYKPYKKTFRDPALVNKYKDYLKPELSIPQCWWQEKNKGLVIKANGEYGFPDRDETVPRTPPPKEEIEELERNIDAACERSTPHQGFRRFISSTNDQ